MNFAARGGAMKAVNHVLQNIQPGRGDRLVLRPWFRIRICGILAVGEIVGVTPDSHMKEDGVEVCRENIIDGLIAFGLRVDVPDGNIDRPHLGRVIRERRDRNQ